ncbi:MAG: hypothetical protein Q9M36_15710 [Sulfurovum sp.]|nr:hypothetical protein [Sulfurovum sp.]
MPCLFKDELVLASPIFDYASLNQKGIENQEFYHYFRDMGPLEMTLRMLEEPPFPIWRLTLQMFPKFSSTLPIQLTGYKVIVQRINLSSSLYQLLAESHGEENVESMLDDDTSSDRHTLHYTISNTSASLNTKNIDYQSIEISSQLWEEVAGDWGTNTPMYLTKSPWEEEINILPSLLRALAQKAGWMGKGVHPSVWMPQELPEGLTEKTPWVEVSIENYIDNNGVYLAQWHDLVADDSISQTLYRVIYDGNENNLSESYMSVLCHRPAHATKDIDKNQPQQMCQ